MKKKHFITFLLSLILASIICEGQAIVNTPDFVPPPADAATLGKYGDVPVTMSNGSTTITVPIYDIKTPRLSLPIGFNYNTAGIKVDDVASWVGLGWSLNAGGVITRAVRGIDDLATKGYYNSTVPLAVTTSSTTSWKFFQDVMNQTQDAEPDYFFYNFGKYAGKFIFNESKVPTIINYQDPLSIKYTGANSFTITDGEGNNYYFNDAETSQSGVHPSAVVRTYTSSWYLTRIVSNDRTDTISFTYASDAVLGQETFDYYESVGPYYTSSIVQNVCNLTFNAIGQDGRGSIVGEPYTNSTPLRLQEINFKNGKVHFYSSATRVDVGGVRLDSVIVSSYDFPTRTYIPIKKVKSAYDNFFTSLPNVPATSPSPYRLRLDSVMMTGGDNYPAGRYKFLYDSTMLPYITSNAKDWFGYYNGKITNVSLIPTQNIVFSSTPYTVGNGDRSCNPDSIQAGVLKWIYYPTGGYTHFTYEPNSYQGSFQDYSQTAFARGTSVQADSVTFTPAITSNVMGTLTVTFTGYNYFDVHTPPYIRIVNVTTGAVATYFAMSPQNGSVASIAYPLIAGDTYRLAAYAFDDNKVQSNVNLEWQTFDGVTVPGGGLRVKQTTDYDFNGRFVKSDLYKYGVGESGFGFLPSSAILLNTNSTTRTYQYTCPGWPQFCGAGPSGGLSRETFCGYSLYDQFSLSGPPVSYSEVAKYQVDSLGNAIGKSIYDYTVYQNNTLFASASYQEGFDITNSGWAGGLLVGKRDYAWKSGVFWPVKTTSLTYTGTSSQIGRGLKLGEKSVFVNNTQPLDSANVQGSCWNAIYYCFDYPIYGGSQMPATQTVLDYDVTDSTKYVVSTRNTTYNYALGDLQPVTITENRSDTGLNVVTNYYPAELSSLTGLSSGEIAAIDTLIAQHNITPVLQTQTNYGNTVTSIVKKHYSLWNSFMALPASVEVQNGSAPSETRLQFLKYDPYGNVQLVGKSGDLKVRYIWDYKNSVPIAEVKNGSDTATAYTSFEADGTGNWTLPDTTRVRGDGFTGTVSYDMTGKTITKLTSGNSYVVSYWAKNGPLTVKYYVMGLAYPATATVGMTKNGWTYYDYIIPATSKILLIGTTSHIDELRLYATAVLMKTYTYQPLAGITCAISETNIPTFYEYDRLNRLKVVRDIDRNAVKVYDYEYQVSPHTFYNTATLLNYTRNNCAICLVGSTVSYTVPAGMFSSLISQADAQSKAITYANVAGQAYANANGTCTTPAIAPITATNSTTSTIMVAFVNNCTGTEYDFRLSTSTGTNWNTVPQGTYTVSIGGGTATTTYYVNGFSQTGSSASFGSVPMVSGYNYFQVH
ncbi:MAG: DUF5977 domain-containing protein [Puia sp.]|nr:DUF5977 domain-containing protein [Puia sp.]